MTDPNYWLSAWLAVMTLYCSIPVGAALKERDLATGMFLLVFVAANTFAALYCAGFVVVMP